MCGVWGLMGVFVCVESEYVQGGYKVVGFRV